MSTQAILQTPFYDLALIKALIHNAELKEANKTCNLFDYMNIHMPLIQNYLEDDECFLPIVKDKEFAGNNYGVYKITTTEGNNYGNAVLKIAV